MTISFTSDAEADDIIARQIAKGHFATADEVVRAGLRLLDRQEADIEESRRLIDEADADIAAGRVHRFRSAEELTSDIVRRGEERLRRKS